MIKHVKIAVLTATVVSFSWTGVAHAFSLGVGGLPSLVPALTAQPAPVPSILPATLSAAGDATTAHVAGAIAPAAAEVTGAVSSVVVPAPLPVAVARQVDDTQLFAGPSDEGSAASAAEYRSFDDIVNDADVGGGWHGPVATTDSFSAAGVDGGVPGFTTFGVQMLLG